MPAAARGTNVRAGRGGVANELFEIDSVLEIFPQKRLVRTRGGPQGASRLRGRLPLPSTLISTSASKSPTRRAAAAKSVLLPANWDPAKTRRKGPPHSAGRGVELSERREWTAGAGSSWSNARHARHARHTGLQPFRSGSRSAAARHFWPSACFTRGLPDPCSQARGSATTKHQQVVYESHHSPASPRA